MKRNTTIALTLAGLIAAGVAATAYAHGGNWNGSGWGGQGRMMGPGMMGGYGPGAGMMGGYGPGAGMMGGYGPGAGMMGGYGPGAGMMGGYGPGAGRHAPGMFGNLDALGAQLQLTDAQQPLLEQLGAAIDAQREAMHGDCPGARAAAESPVERMNQRVERMEQRIAGMKAINAAFGKLYASLDDEQRQQVSAMLQRGGRGRHGMQRHMHGS